MPNVLAHSTVINPEKSRMTGSVKLALQPLPVFTRRGHMSLYWQVWNKQKQPILAWKPLQTCFPFSTLTKGPHAVI